MPLRDDLDSSWKETEFRIVTKWADREKLLSTYPKCLIPEVRLRMEFFW
jgi:hypothetical protein